MICAGGDVLDNGIIVTGMVLSAIPVGEYDKRLVILTAERGKVSAFARGVRRAKSAYAAGCRPFTFGDFTLAEGRSSYTIRHIEVKNYFTEVAEDMNSVYLGFYFLELADYYTRENADELNVLKLLYQTLRALSNASIPNTLVRMVYELKIMIINGDFNEYYLRNCPEIVKYTVNFIIETSVERLFTFRLTDEAMKELQEFTAKNFSAYITKELHSLEVIRSMEEGLK